MILHIAKVVDVHPEGNAVDVVLASDGRMFPGVSVLSGVLTGQTGVVDLHVPDLTTDRKNEDLFAGKWASLNTRKRDILALVGFADGTPLCLGFLPPPECELNFPAEIGEERRISRHASDVYSWTDKNGNTQACHPNGSYATLSEDPDKLDLTGKDYDKLWKIRRNLRRVVHFFAALWNGEEQREVARIHVHPNGDVDISTAGTIRIDGEVRMSGSIRLNGDVKINGITQVGD